MRIQSWVFSRGIAGHAAELDQLPAEMDDKLRAEYCRCFGGQLRESQFQVAHAHAAQPSKDPVDGEGKAAASRRAKPRGIDPRVRATATTSQYSKISRIVEGKDQFSLRARPSPAAAPKACMQKQTRGPAHALPPLAAA